MTRQKSTGCDLDCAPRDSVDALLQSWAECRPDLDFRPVGVITRLARVRAHLDAELEEVFAGSGLTGPSFAALVTLARISGEHGVSQRRLADELGLTPGTVSVRVDRLVERLPRFPHGIDYTRLATLCGIFVAGNDVFLRGGCKRGSTSVTDSPCRK